MKHYILDAGGNPKNVPLLEWAKIFLYCGKRWPLKTTMRWMSLQSVTC